MKAQILIRKKIPATSSKEAMDKIRKKYPDARLISWRFHDTYVGSRVPDWKNRTMDVAFIDDASSIWDDDSGLV